ncbi:alpha/beta hydrolase [Foetidibacter luteolus]|uniref:alpha/beta hydrolase n=1 Tax=Foetidibacter luteolus TaxID=2608880 RepID=UPI00129BAEED|nr:alpha/beta fold hydrolase [Foetidibacter luteolus]
MKLAQRMAFGYYKTKFKALGAVSPRKAAEAAFTLFCTPYHGKPKRKMPAVFNKATSFQLSFQQLTVRGFEWKNDKSTNGHVLICHGFDSSCYKFADYVTPLLNKGYAVTTFDAPGHGISDGKTINALLYSQLMLELEVTRGPFSAIMAHSLGGLALSLSMEKMENSASKKIVLVAPATETTTAIQHFFHFIPVTPKVRKEFDNLLYELGGKPPQWYSVTRAVQNTSCKILWLHDKADQVCPFEDTKTIRQLKLPNLQFLVTNNLGHSKIYKEPAVQKAIVDFICDSHFNVNNITLPDVEYQWM